MVGLILTLAVVVVVVRPPSSGGPGPSADPSVAQGGSSRPSLDPATSAPSATRDAPSEPAAGLAALIATLPVAAEHRAGYDRDRFEHWIDADGDGCDTRREVLIAEAVVAPTVEAGCFLVGGSWLSAYDGLTLTEIGRIDVDHVVALAEAWDSGAWAWTDARRRAFANDLGVEWTLIAVSASSNRSKSDLDPADWLPSSAGAVCPYLGAWVAVKVRWALTIDPAEKTALARLVPACPGPTPEVLIAP